ncbi:phosphatidate cytidylyltransferase, mitochondrial-like [Panonychus citri]|uniref:phosphatidate cytidylyltransferase, mitochondrial-like n=1 Tax=Panonychus citri TaxID=50023 RepID=UPI00230770FD|nr:phosphatidate cytidylyltransferase, mitochondrial-like [Panonychus citri]XP_053205848.1 phosphatidate cytidylyltransferase, mitochondrial-like [Panonychus citri]
MSLVNSYYLKNLLSLLPGGYCFAFAYGSAVFKQSVSSLGVVGHSVNSTTSPSRLIKPINKLTSWFSSSPSSSEEQVKMIDMIVVVDDSLKFHENNLSTNQNHYSILKRFGAKVITNIQDNFGASIYFNTLIPIKDDNGAECLLKYGIINRKNLINDLYDWDHLYTSGRLHKPVKIIHSPSDDGSISKALTINHQNALYSALLLLSETFTEEQLFITIANLSYDGDFRMTFGEDRNKVAKIVKPNIEKFKSIYQPYIGSSIEKGLLSFNSNQRIYFQDLSPRVICHNLSLLPKRVQQNLYFNYESRGKLRDLDDVLMAIAQSYKYSDDVRQAIRQIVRKSSWTQSAKGVFTAGLIKSMKYSTRKLIKMSKS